MRWLHRPPPSSTNSQNSSFTLTISSALRWHIEHFRSTATFKKCKRNISAVLHGKISTKLFKIILISFLIIPHYGSCGVVDETTVADTVNGTTYVPKVTVREAEDVTVTQITAAAADTAVWRKTPPTPFEETPPLMPEFKFDDDSLPKISPSQTNLTNEPEVQAISISNSEIFRETGYGHKKRSNHQFPQRRQQYTSNDESFANPTTTTPAPLNLAEISVVSPTDEILFYANESLVHVRTENWLLPFNACMEARFRLEGKRTRLLIYTCQMTEGGECVLDKFTALDALNAENVANHNETSPAGEFGNLQIERCVRLRPWMYFKTPFAFHFKFVRRPRRFSDPAMELRFARRRRLGRRATREVGRVTLKGFKECDRSCVREADSGGWNDEGSILESTFSVVKYGASKRRKRRRLHPKVVSN